MTKRNKSVEEMRLEIAAYGVNLAHFRRMGLVREEKLALKEIKRLESALKKASHGKE